MHERKAASSCAGFRENLRILCWIIDRCEDRVGARQTPIGFLPEAGDLDIRGLDVSPEAMDTLLSIDAGQWRQEMESIGDYLGSFGDRLPEALRREYETVLVDLKKSG